MIHLHLETLPQINAQKTTLKVNLSLIPTARFGREIGCGRLLSECSVFLDKASFLNCGDNGRNQSAKLYWGRGEVGGLNSSKLKM